MAALNWRDRLAAEGRPQPSEVSPPIAQRINDFIAGNFPNAVCDRCVCEALGFLFERSSCPDSGRTRDYVGVRPATRPVRTVQE